MAGHCTRVGLHLDLHETTDTDTDSSEHGRGNAARDGVAFARLPIPDGFCVVDDIERPVPAFQRKLIESVCRVNQLAESDTQGRS